MPGVTEATVAGQEEEVDEVKEVGRGQTRQAMWAVMWTWASF